MRPGNWPRHLRKCSRKLQGVTITNCDFEEVVADTPDGAFLFVDPPYFNADQDKFYACSFTHEDHVRLAGVLREHSWRLKFLLTYDNTPEVRELYNWACSILDKEWNYTINRTDDQSGRTRDKGKRYQGREVFILNYDAELCREQLPLGGAQVRSEDASSDRLPAVRVASGG